jgi:hypothetical protein
MYSRGLCIYAYVAVGITAIITRGASALLQYLIYIVNTGLALALA